MARERPLLLPNASTSLFQQLSMVLVSDLDATEPAEWLSHKIWIVRKTSQNLNKTWNVLPLQKIQKLVASFIQCPRGNY